MVPRAVSAPRIHLRRRLSAKRRHHPARWGSDIVSDQTYQQPVTGRTLGDFTQGWRAEVDDFEAFAEGCLDSLEEFSRSLDERETLLASDTATLEEIRLELDRERADWEESRSEQASRGAQELQSLVEERDRLAAELAGAQARLGESEAELVSLNETLEEARELQEQATREGESALLRERARWEQSIDLERSEWELERQAWSEKESLRAEETQSSIALLEDSVRELREELGDLAVQRDSLEANLSRVTEQLSLAESRLLNAQDDLARSLEEAETHFRERLAEAESIRDELTLEREAWRDERAHLTQAHESELADWQARYELRDESALALEQQLMELETERADHAERLEARRIEELHEFDDRLQDLQDRSEELAAKVTSFETEREAWSSEREALGHALAEAQEKISIAADEATAARGVHLAMLESERDEATRRGEDLSLELAEREREQEALRAEHADQVAALAAEKDDLIAELAAARLDRSDDAEEDSSRFLELETRVRELSAELDTARSQIGRLAGAAMELADARAEAAAAKSELAEWRDKASRSEQTVGEAERQRSHEAELERARLEWELESVRNRAAELAEQLTQEKRRVADERAEWTGQLKQLRRTIERQAQLAAENQSLVGAGVALATGAAAKPANGATCGAHLAARPDPVLESVMSQFEMLQKDLARRRTTAKPAKPT